MLGLALPMREPGSDLDPHPPMRTPEVGVVIIHDQLWPAVGGSSLSLSFAVAHPKPNHNHAQQRTTDDDPLSNSHSRSTR